MGAYPTALSGSKRASTGINFRIAIIGGGASGTLMALALVRVCPDLRVTIIEPSAAVGRGVAYRTSTRGQRLNVLPGKLSVRSDDAGDFARWLVAKGKIASTDEKAFVPRELFGDYLGECLNAESRLDVIHDAVTAIDTQARHARIALASGGQIGADAVILATGHSWAPGPDAGRDVPIDAPVTILGSGLSMVDKWLVLREAGHRGTITAVSRHGLVPLDHDACSAPAKLPVVPLGSPVSRTMRWLRNLAAEVPDWRMAVDAIRPHMQSLWQAWSVTERRRFLRHARRYWDVHRHRIAPDIGERLAGEIASGTLRVTASRAADTTGIVFDCRGYFPDWAAIRSPLIAELVRTGMVRPDPVGIGLDVTADCRVIGRNGAASPRLFAVGPPTRGRFWEIEAIPDIRPQCEALAARLAAALPRAAEADVASSDRSLRVRR